MLLFYINNLPEYKVFLGARCYTLVLQNAAYSASS